MIQLEKIKLAHSKVKSGADFPAYVQDLIKIGVTKYDTFVSDGHALYFEGNDYQIQSEPKYALLDIANTASQDKFRNYLKIHQQGQTDYLTFCRHSAETGVEKWTVDTEHMTCTYYDKAGHKMLEEKIPKPG